MTYCINNSDFTLRLSEGGVVQELRMIGDPSGMNWVVDPAYPASLGYDDRDKLFGHFALTVNGADYGSYGAPAPLIEQTGETGLSLSYRFAGFDVSVAYDMRADGALDWHIRLASRSGEPLRVDSFKVWASVAYIMYRDSDVERNMKTSCAVFPSISPHFSKLACVRRSNEGPHLGLYALAGTTRSVGTYCRFTNDFFKNVSPSLDGILYHQLVLIDGGGEPVSGPSGADWIYGGGEATTLGAGETLAWSYRLLPFADREGFYARARAAGHPTVEAPPAVVAGGMLEARIYGPGIGGFGGSGSDGDGDGGGRPRVRLISAAAREEVTDRLAVAGDGYVLRMRLEQPGERQLVVELADGRTDFVVFNVTEPADRIIDMRVDYICRTLYAGAESEFPHAILPISNQGESLGKAALVLMSNAMGTVRADQVRIVENSAVHYIRPKWFQGGDFRRPARLYGSFYRTIDFDYAAHVFYLLSRFDAGTLAHHEPSVYLRWAAEVMILRLDADLHEDERERKETEMPGTYVLFIAELIRDLGAAGLTAEHARLSALWDAASLRLRAESATYRGAITEHFYDNAGFGPTFEALCLSDSLPEARRYGELLLANIGYSNDFRAQNPDRWWEALSYMIHSLWGGLAAASALVGYERLRETEYLLAAYRATAAVFYCYDWHATATSLKLRPGEAASTYSVAGPHLNRPDLSRARFGQSVFREADGEIFAGLFGEDAGYDWDMGEELVAYLAGFGTKTFLYYRDGEVCCANGELVRRGDRYEITSYAAYPREYYFYEEKVTYIVPGGGCSRHVVFEKGAFSDGA